MRRCGYLLFFWWKSQNIKSAKPEVELAVTVAPMKKILNVKSLNGERYHVGLKVGKR